MPAPHDHSADVLVLQHLIDDGPGYLGQWLDAQDITWHVFCAESGESYPDSVSDYRGLAILGGAWSANDDRASLRLAEDLIRQADVLGIPIIGHCLGGQLMARAFGGRVEPHTPAEIGWMPLIPTHSSQCHTWLGDADTHMVYQWHHDNFVTLPQGAELIASSPGCQHQAFAIGPHLAMQFHVEITEQKITRWMKTPGDGFDRLVENHPATVQSLVDMTDSTMQHISASQALADRIYHTWHSRFKKVKL